MKDLTNRYAVREPSGTNWQFVVTAFAIAAFWCGVCWLFARAVL